jgi:hypothetical protein
MAFASFPLYYEYVGIDIRIESDLIQPTQRSFHSPLAASR